MELPFLKTKLDKFDCLMLSFILAGFPPEVLGLDTKVEATNHAPGHQEFLLGPRLRQIQLNRCFIDRLKDFGWVNRYKFIFKK